MSLKSDFFGADIFYNQGLFPKKSMRNFDDKNHSKGCQNPIKQLHKKLIFSKLIYLSINSKSE